MIPFKTIPIKNPLGILGRKILGIQNKKLGFFGTILYLGYTNIRIFWAVLRKTDNSRLFLI